MKIFKRIVALVLAVLIAFSISGMALAATAVNLGTAASYAVLGGSTVTNTGPTTVSGNLGLSPGTSVTGFPPGTVNGVQHVTDAAAAQAQADLVTAYNAASGQTTAVTMVSGDLGGQTLTPGIYKSTSALGLTGTVTLDGQGNPDAVFLFQVGSALTTASASRVLLINNAQACNIFWQVGSSATLGTNSNFAGTILALASVTVNTGASVSGRVLARNGAVTLDTNPVSRPTCAAPAVVPPPVVPPPVVPPVIVPPVVIPPVVPPPVVSPVVVPPPAATSTTVTTTSTTTPVVPIVITPPPATASTVTPVVVPAVVPTDNTPAPLSAPSASVALNNLPNTGIGLADELPWYLMFLAALLSPLLIYVSLRNEKTG